ncbi:MAG: DUF1127 domain-containing protein [Pseudomonadota bacterium]
MTMLTRSGLKMMDEYRRRAQMRRLLDYDDKMLTDMGLSRGDLEVALQQPITVDAGRAAWEGSRLTLGMDRARVLAPGEARQLAMRVRRPQRDAHAPSGEGLIDRLLRVFSRWVTRGA